MFAIWTKVSVSTDNPEIQGASPISGFDVSQMPVAIGNFLITGMVARIMVR